eukprot:10390522-Alexandrium_andersonii.AAC.1
MDPVLKEQEPGPLMEFIEGHLRPQPQAGRPAGCISERSVSFAAYVLGPHAFLQSFACARAGAVLLHFPSFLQR